MTLLLLTLLTSTAAACSWTRSTPPPARWMSAASTTCGDTVAFSGGESLSISTGATLGDRNKVTTFNPTTHTWHTWAPNMTGRVAPAAASLNSRLYVFGGTKKIPNASHSAHPVKILDLVESISFSPHGMLIETSWKQEKPLPFGPRESPSAASLPNSAGIVIGAGFFSKTVNGVLTFKYFNDSWFFDGSDYTRLPDMPFSRSNMPMVAANKGIYAFGGGFTEPSYSTCAYLQVESATSHASDWIKCPPLVTPTSWMSAGVLKDKHGEDVVIAAGGMDGMFSPTSVVEALSGGSSSSALGGGGGGNWSNLNCDLPFAAGFLSGAVVNNSFVVVAGAAPYPAAHHALIFNM